MSDIYNINWQSYSDRGILLEIGAYIRHHRLEQNKTQQQLADEAGINRITLLEFEKGKPSGLITFIQLLRALDLLHIIQQFHIEIQPSPLQLAEIQMKMRKRASGKKPNSKTKKNKSDW